MPPRRLDLLTEITGVTFDEATTDHLTVPIDGHPVRFIGRDALIRNKTLRRRR